MKYKDYLARVDYDPDNRIFRGRVVGVNSILTFQGMTVDEIEQGFKDTIDGYLGRCKEEGKKPEKTYSGTFNLRLDPELHQRLTMGAALYKTSLNKYIIFLLTEELRDDD